MTGPSHYFRFGVTAILTVSLITLSQIGRGADQSMNTIPVTVSLGDPLARVFGTNHLDDKKYREPNRRDGMLVALEAKASDETAPDGYALRYVDGPCSLDLPAGRMLHLRHYAGFVDSIASVLPTETLPYTHVLILVDRIVSALEGAGFARQRLDEPPRAGGLPEGARLFRVGRWQGCTLSGIGIGLEILYYNRMPTGYSTVPMVGTPIPEDAPDQYLLRIVIFHEEIRHEASDLRYARRIAINGNKRKFIPLSVWLDDPDWRPEDWDGRYIK